MAGVIKITLDMLEQMIELFEEHVLITLAIVCAVLIMYVAPHSVETYAGLLAAILVSCMVANIVNNWHTN